jgi:hypothetical protein
MCTCATRGCVVGSTVTCVVDASAGLHYALLLCMFGSVFMVLQQQDGMVGHLDCKGRFAFALNSVKLPFVFCLTRDTRLRCSMR